MSLAHANSLSAATADALFSNFFGWQFVVTFGAVAAVLVFQTLGAAVVSATLEYGNGSLSPFEEYQGFVNISSAFFALTVSFSAAIITNQLAQTVIIVGILLFFWTVGLGGTIQVLLQRKKQRATATTVNQP